MAPDVSTGTDDHHSTHSDDSIGSVTIRSRTVPAAPALDTDAREHQSGSMTQITADTIVRSFADRYAAAVLSLDADGLAGLYAADVHVVDAFLPGSIQGLDAWRTCIAEWFGGLDPADGNRAEVVVTRAELSGELLWASGSVRYAELDPDGQERGSVTNRLGWVLRREIDGEWRIAHEHTSVAVDLEAGTAVLS